MSNWFVIGLVLSICLHNLEEALWLPRWSESAESYKPVESFKFRFAVLLLSLMAVAFGLGAMVQRHGGAFAFLVSAYGVVMATNTLFPHIIFSIVHRKYMPGTASGLFLVWPTAFCVVYSYIKDGSVSGLHLLWFCPLFGLILLGLIPVLFSIGNKIKTTI